MYISLSILRYVHFGVYTEICTFRRVQPGVCTDHAWEGLECNGRSTGDPIRTIANICCKKVTDRSSRI